MRRTTVLLCTALLSVSAHAQSPTKIEFWHAMTGVKDRVAGYARDFNRSQDRFEVVPVAVGSYRDLLPKLQAAIRAGKAPALAQLELTQLPDLAASGGLTDLSGAVDDLPDALRNDFLPAVWKTGVYAGKNYGLPWNISVPALLYNANILRSSPEGWTWTQMEAASRKLATRGRRPLVLTAEAWTFEANVLSRGGSLVENGKPALNSPEAVEALTQMARMSAQGLAQPRSLNDVTGGALDFARGQNLFIMASVANWIDARRIPMVKVGLAPFPCEKANVCTVPLGGGTLVVPKGASAAERAGALAFWQYLMGPERLADWVEATAYVPPRRSVTPLLSNWYAQNPQMRSVHAQVNRAVPRPALPEYADWIPLIEKAIDQAITGKLSAKAALDAAQKAALK